MSETTSTVQNAATADAASEDKPSYIESASATTNPDNVNSGVKAYVITAVAIVLLLALSVTMSSCMAAMGAIAAKAGSSKYRVTGTDTGTTNTKKYDLDDDYDLDDIDIDSIINDTQNTRGNRGGSSYSFSY
jgi:hypothetical protein